MTRIAADAGPGCNTEADRSRRFRVTAGRFGTIDGVRLSDSGNGTWALFAMRGGTLIDWVVPFGGELLSLTDGYRSRAELYAQDGVRNGVMAPFPNRIAGGRYHFGYRDHDLLPGVPEAERLTYHGFLRNLDLALVDTRADDEGAEALLFSDAIQPGVIAGYPFALSVQLRVRLGPEGLSLMITATNMGHRTAPYAAGWHPYFRFGEGSIDTLELQVPAQACIATDASLLPLPGSAAHAAIETRPELDLRKPRALGASMIDASLHVQPDADGMIRTRLRDPRRGCGLSVWQEGGLVHLFTGDTLARGPRRSIAIEPVEVMADAFNRSDCRTAIELAPGASRSFRCGAQFQAKMELR